MTRNLRCKKLHTITGLLFSPHFLLKIAQNISLIFFSSFIFQDRNRVRNEFIGLKLIDVLKSLRGRGVSDDLGVQLDVFEEQRESDEAHIEGKGVSIRLQYTGCGVFKEGIQN